MAGHVTPLHALVLLLHQVISEKSVALSLSRMFRIQIFRTDLVFWSWIRIFCIDLSWSWIQIQQQWYRDYDKNKQKTF